MTTVHVVWTGVCRIHIGCCSLTRYCTHSMHESSQNLMWTIVLVLVPVYNPTCSCALLGYMKVYKCKWIRQCGVEWQPNMETLRGVKLNSFDIIPWHHKLWLDKPEWQPYKTVQHNHMQYQGSDIKNGHFIWTKKLFCCS